MIISVNIVAFFVLLEEGVFKTSKQTHETSRKIFVLKRDFGTWYVRVLVPHFMYVQYVVNWTFWGNFAGASGTREIEKVGALVK